MDLAGRGDRSSKLVRAPKTAELIADHLRSSIVRGVLKKGDVLPTEVELVRQFGVSRPTLREAFRILESESLIVVRRGSRGGVLVSSPETAVAARDFGLLLQMSKTTLADVYEARKVFEPAAAELLANRARPDDIAELQSTAATLAELIADGTEQADFREWSAAVFRFHDVILDRSGNNTMALVGAVLRDIVTKHMERVVRTAAGPGVVEKQFKQTLRTFEKFIALVEDGDGAGARDLWTAHMNRAGRRMLWGDLANETVIDLYS
ncbi:GntR family transcriptional regulator [Mycobacterium holsaticum DSM 44478]|nr:GntR family transcriptional regulator [Mycolicibacterium holsaticum DSM 44478 = JCM 12374]QZA15228.1 FCD domain-containing protein [Mycolicibacterium holsaticum DSM 44478 = JCM 12374]UNC12501.1 FadR family transcriptional regulator [Mycolicibacterium holsaticum DSM 44478 = JCM 12374]